MKMIISYLNLFKEKNNSNIIQFNIRESKSHGCRGVASFSIRSYTLFPGDERRLLSPGIYIYE